MSFKFTTLKELQKGSIDYILLELIMGLQDTISRIESSALKDLQEGKFESAKESAIKANYFKWFQHMNDLKQSLWDNGSSEVIRLIVMQEGFTKQYGSDKFIIPLSVLPDFKYKEYPAKGVHAEMAKHLGAKLTS